MVIQIAPTTHPASRHQPGLARLRLISVLTFLLLLTGVLGLQADQVEMRNGDRYVGKVLSLNSTTLTLRNEILGTVKLPRSKVTRITLGTATPRLATKASPALHTPASRARISTKATHPTNDFSNALQQLGANTNLVQQIASQFLAGAGPEANARFNSMLAGLISGKVTIGDLRAQAKAAADQLRSLQHSLGKDAGGTLDGYLAILDDFVNETAPSPAGTTNAPSASPKVKTAPASKQ